MSPGVRINGTALLQTATLFGPLDVDVLAGGWTCILGASGVGKTTLLRLIAGLETAAIFEGEIVASDGLAIHRRVSWMAQTDLLMPWLDVLGNISLGGRLRGDGADRDRARALADRLELTPHLTKRPGQLSGGQRQRVALARTLMENREIVLLDEPFSALDSRLRAEMQELFAAELQGRTVLLITHEPLEAARLGEQLYVMRESGMVTADPPPHPVVRAEDHPDTLACQACLMALLREKTP